MTFLVVAANIELGARLLVAGAFVLCAIVAGTHWAVRGGKIAPFGAWARFVRGWSDPMLKPVERRIVRAGANPQDAPVWLLGISVVAGLAFIALVRWTIGFIANMIVASDAGTNFLLRTLVNYGFALLMAAILFRVVASWFGISPYTRFMRLIHGLTDWLIEPLQRVIPTFGPIDVSPIAAYLILSVARTLVMGAFF